VALSIACTSTPGIVIDDFTEGQVLLQATNYSPGATMVQTNLNADSVIGGTRRAYAGSQVNSVAEVNATDGDFIFEATSGFGYFELGYGTEFPLGVDLRADGSDAFLVSFADVYTPGLPGTAGISLRVNDVNYSLSKNLHATNAAVTIRIPFAHFTSGETFIANQIRLIGLRVPGASRFVLNSIVTVAPPRLSITVIAADEIRLGWSTNHVGYIVESASSVVSEQWDVMTNAVNNVVGEQFHVAINPADGKKFFRLRSQ
jgi:hypothetical protein